MKAFETKRTARGAFPALIKAAILALLIAIPSAAAGFDLKGRVHEFRLANGMKWLLVRRTHAPVFSGVVMLKAGGADERPGKTGLAHMFEHMAFKGSPSIGTRDWEAERPILEEIERVGQRLTLESLKEPKDEGLIAELSKRLAELERKADAVRNKNEIWEVMTRNGASDLNAYTSKDVTAFHASMPSDRLNLWAMVFAEMIFRPSFREFYTERSVIAEERRAGIDNSPDGAMSERILSAAFADGPYGWPTIGREADIRGFTIADAREFHSRYYIPSNMVGVIVGDVTLAEARAAAERSFGRFGRRGPPPLEPAPGHEAGGTVVEFPFRARPSVAVAWHKPTLPDPAEYAFDLIEAILCGGNSSRLEKKLVYDKKLAESVYCTTGYPGSRMPNLFLVWAEPMRSTHPDVLLDEIEREVAALSAGPVCEAELERAKRQVRSRFVYGLESNMNLALWLAQFETIFGDWRLLADYPDRISAVTADDIAAAARRYLKDQNRVAVIRTSAKGKGAAR